MATLRRGSWLLVFSPLIWWGGLASSVRVRSDAGGNPAFGELVATVPFIVIGMVALLALGILQRTMRQLVGLLALVILGITVAVYATAWEGLSFYLPVGLFSVTAQYLVLRRFRKDVAGRDS